jgi:hypothetical protein
MNSGSNSKGFFSGLTNAVSGAVGGVTNFITGNNKKNSNSNMKIVAPVNNSNSKPAAIPVVAGGRRKMRKTKTKARKTKRRASHKRKTGRKH